MKTFLRTAGAAGVFWFLTNGAIASPAMEAAFNLPEWSEPVALPSATASSVIEDRSVQLASDNEPAAAEATSSADCGNGCNTCCEQMCCSCCPTWYASVGAVILHRDRPDPGTVVAANPAGTSFSRASDFGFGWDAGPDVTIGYRDACGQGWEGRYFGVDSTDDNVFTTPGNFIGAGFTGPGGTLFTGKYLTKLNSSELNWRNPQSDRVTFLAGFRWVELKDEMFYKLSGNVATGDYEYNNRLYGGQAGWDIKLTNRCNPLQMNIVGKGGVYGNVADGGIYEFQGNNFIGSFTSKNTTCAFVGEIQFSATYQLTQCLSLRGGYELLWLDNVALAGDAASRSLLNPSLLREVDNHNDLFYNGATASIDYVW